MTPTRFPELSYTQVTRDLWRIVDNSTGAAVGPHYKRKGELLLDLPRFARDFGAVPAVREQHSLTETDAAIFTAQNTRTETLYGMRRDHARDADVMLRCMGPAVGMSRHAWLAGL
jgi:hypothetical protein